MVTKAGNTGAIMAQRQMTVRDPTHDTEEVAAEALAVEVSRETASLTIPKQAIVGLALQLV
jgi:hypothetical protein